MSPRLDAAAPDMLAALKGCITPAQLVQAGSLTALRNALTEVNRIARAAIAKAEGRDGFAAFQASRKRSETICADIGFDDGLPERGGYVYDGGYIEENTVGMPDVMARGKYYLLIERFDWISDDLEEMERILWACHTVYECAADGFTLTGADLDAFVQGHCAYNNIRVDGDVFGQAFSGQDAYTPHDAARIINDAARLYKLYNAIGEAQ